MAHVIKVRRVSDCVFIRCECGLPLAMLHLESERFDEQLYDALQNHRIHVRAALDIWLQSPPQLSPVSQNPNPIPPAPSSFSNAQSYDHRPR